jgi:hypothetical protein
MKANQVQNVCGLFLSILLGLAIVARANDGITHIQSNVPVPFTQNSVLLPKKNNMLAPLTLKTPERLDKQSSENVPKSVATAVESTSKWDSLSSGLKPATGCQHFQKQVASLLLMKRGQGIQKQRHRQDESKLVNLLENMFTENDGKKARKSSSLLRTNEPEDEEFLPRRHSAP